MPPARPAQGDYDAICAAVMHSARGRWFLDEFARRNRNDDTTLLLDAIERIEAVIRGDRSREAFQSFRVGLLEMARAIAETRAEVAGIKPEPAPHGKLAQPAKPAASPSPDVFAAAERIQDVVWAMRERGLDPAMCEQIEALATSILSASSLRDPNSHRAQKLGEVLQSLERRINTMLEDVASAEESAQAPSEAIAASEATGEDQLSSTDNGHDPRAMQAAAAERVPAPSDAIMEPRGGPAPSVVATAHEDDTEIEIEPLLVAPAGVPVGDGPASELELAPIAIAPRFEAATAAAPVPSAAHADDAPLSANLSSASDLSPEATGQAPPAAARQARPEAIEIAPRVAIQVERPESASNTPAELQLDPIKVELRPAPAAVPTPTMEETVAASAAEATTPLAEAAPAANSSELSERPSKQSAGFSNVKAAVVVDLESLALAIDVRAADRPAEPIAAKHEPPASSAVPAHVCAQPESAAAAISEPPPETADAMLEIERDLFAADAESVQAISRTAPPAQPLPEPSRPTPVEQASQTVLPPAVAIAMTVTAAVPVQMSSGPQPWEADLIPALPNPPPAQTAAAIPVVDLVATAVAETSSLSQTPARPVAKPTPRLAPSDPLAAFKALSDEERIALFT